MSTFCEVALALGMTFSGICLEPPTITSSLLPGDDKGVWDYQRRPPPPAPLPAPPAFPPIVIEKTIIKEVLVPTPAPPTPPKPAPKPAPPPPPKSKAKPDYTRTAISLAYAARSAQGWTDIVIPATANTAASGTRHANTPTSVMSGTFAKVSVLKPPKDERYLAESVTSSMPVDNTRILTADRYIAGVIETGVNSQIDDQLAGSIIIQTSRDTFGYHGRKILIPKGSRLICQYKAPEKQGTTRIAIRCGRILLAGHRAEIFQLSTNAGDQQGRAGLSGEVDNRFWEKYGTAFVLAAISATVRGAAASMSASETMSDSSSTFETSAEELSTKLGEISAAILEKTVDLAPIIILSQGTRIQIRPEKDWFIRGDNE